MARHAPDADRGLGALQAEIAGYRALLQLLQAEQSVLRGACADELPPIAAAKLLEIDKLLELGRARDPSIARSDDPETAAGVEQLFRLAADARRMNDINGRMIAVQQHHFDRALAALWHAAGVTPLYGADGRHQGAVPPRTFAAI